ncbi:MAG: hypothetical protein EHM83_01910 [Burkholderiales bacterium]|nr:MAG: hypothetical protein EHM83_01910 [Burkholderiales bacterium]
MKALSLPVLAVVAAMSGGCAGTTPISDLALPPVSTIEGTVTHAGDDGFTLADGTGSILVRARLPGGRKLNVSAGEKVRVHGNLLGGQDRVFDGYVIRKPTGEQIIVSKPTPHFGLVIQSSFE